MTRSGAIEGAHRTSDFRGPGEPRPRVAEPEDWRTKAQLREDAELEGTWFRCRDHGLLTPEGVVHLSIFTYCGKIGCGEIVLLAHSAMSDPAAQTDWTRTPDRTTFNRPRRPARPDRPEDETVPRSNTTQTPMLKDVILELLADGQHHSSKAIREAVEERTGKGKSSSAILSQLAKRGAIRRTGSGVWQIASAEAPLDDAAAGQVEDSGGGDGPGESEDDASAGSPDLTPPAVTSCDAAPAEEPPEARESSESTRMGRTLLTFIPPARGEQREPDPLPKHLHIRVEFGFHSILEVKVPGDVVDSKSIADLCDLIAGVISGATE